MARSARARQLTETHRLAQLRLGAATIRQLLAAWRILDLEDLDGTIAKWLRVVFPIIGQQRASSAQLAAGYLVTFRTLEVGADEGFVPSVSDVTMNAKALTTSMTVTGPVAVKLAMSRGLTLAQAGGLGAARSAAAGMRYALEGGRETLLETIRADDAALGWARAVSGRACAFCAMLASRGPVYSKNTVDFKTHDHCSCSAEPVYERGGAWPAGSERYRDLWDQSTGGRSGAEAVKAFRTALEG